MSKSLESEIFDKSASVLPLHYFLFHFTICSLLKSVNAIKKQNTSLCKLYSIYEEIPEEFLDETDVDSFFYHNILDLSQTQHRIVRNSKESNKKIFAFKVFHSCESKLQQRCILKEEVSFSKKEIESLLDSWVDFLKAFDQANKVSQIPLLKLKFEIRVTKAKDELFRHCYKDIVEHLNREIRLSFRFEKNETFVFSLKILNNTVINSFLQKLSTWVTAKSNISTRIDFLLPKIVTFLRAHKMFSAFTPDCGFDKKMNFLTDKQLFINVPFQLTKYRKKEWCLDNKVQKIIGEVYCPTSRNEKYVYISTSKTTSFYDCKKCKACCHVLNIPFKYQKPTIMLFGGDGTHCLARKSSRN